MAEAVANTLVYESVANSWSQGGALNDIRRNAAGAMILKNGKQTPYILGGYGEPGGFIDPIHTSEVAAPGPFGSDVALRPAVAHARPTGVPTS